MKNFNSLFCNPKRGESHLSRYCLLLASYSPLTCLLQLRYAAMVLLLTIGVGNAWGTPQTYNFSSLVTTGWTKSGTSRTINGISWTYSASTYIGCDGSKIQIGSKKNPQTTNWTIQTAISNFGASKKVTAVAITGYVTQNANNSSYDISVGGSSVKSGSFTTSSATYTANSLNVTSGNIVITLRGASGTHALYLSNISVTYDDAGSTKTLGYSVQPTGTGTVELGATSLAPSATTTATATASAGYAFSSWGISGTGASLSSTSTNPTTITMGSADATVTANFSCVTPTFGTNLSTSTVNYTTGASASALTVAASANNATINYQWQTSTDNSNWSNTGTNASGNTSITPSTAAAGTTYYRCIATNTASGCSTTATSNVATITVSAPTPATITLKNYSGDATTTGYYSGGSFTLPATNDFTCGELTFVGWSSAAIISPSATKPASNYYEPGESVTLGASNTFYAVFAIAGAGGTTTKTDDLTYTNFFSACDPDATNSSFSYTAFSGKNGPTSDAVYAGMFYKHGNGTNCKDYIQMRTTNSNSGLVSTTTGGKAKKVTVVWNTNTGNNKVVDIYGKSTAYTAASDLFDDEKKGESLGSITKGTSTYLTITGDYEFIGLRSNDGAIYFDEISIDWQAGGGVTYSNYTTNCVNMRTVYLDAYHFGDTDGAKFAIYSWKDGSDDNKLSETFMTKVTDCYYEHLYEGEMPDNHDRVFFLRNASAAASPVKEGANKLNQTVNITTDGDKDFFTIASGGEGNTYTGAWSVYTPHYTVTFDKNGAGTTDSWPSDQCVANGGKASEPSSPQTMGKNFVGWYQEAEGTNAWVFNTNTVTAATTIYAKWNDVATKTIYLDASATLSGSKTWDADNTVLFVRAYINGTSIGTNIKATGAISTCQPHVYAFTIPGNADYVSFARCATGTTELPASWDNDPVYNKIVGMAIESGKDHYKVTDWGSATLESSAFAPESYTISYSAGTGGSGTRDAESKACDVAFTLPNAQVFTRDGYTMDGWATEDGGAKEYDLGGSYTTNAAQTFYPHWAAANYSVTLNVNGGTINAGNVTSYTFGTGATLPTDVTKAHATFQGWYAASNFSGERVYSISTSEYGDKAYWAKWETITYTVTWKANGGIVRTDTEVAEGGKVASVPSAPADLTTDPNGCDAEFVGWAVEDPGPLSISTRTTAPTGMFTDVAGSPTITGDVTFVAIYRQEQP